MIRKAWLEAPEHPILKTAILETLCVLVLLPPSIGSTETLD